MKKTIIAIVIAIASFQAHAGASDYCNMKRTQYEHDQCVEMGVRGSMLRLKGNSERMLQNANVSQADKINISETHKEWKKAVQKKCGDSAACFWDMASQRNAQIEQMMTRYGIPAL